MTLRYNTTFFCSICLVIFFLAASQARSQTCEGVAEISWPGDVLEQLRWSARDDEGTPIEMEVKWRVYVLAGEPVKQCVARWKLRKDSTWVRIKDPTPGAGPEATITVYPPPGVRQQISISQVMLSGESSSIWGNTIGSIGKTLPPEMSIPFDPGVMAKHGEEWSFNVPGSPAWSRLFHDRDYWRTHWLCSSTYELEQRYALAERYEEGKRSSLMEEVAAVSVAHREEGVYWATSETAQKTVRDGFSELNFKITKIRFDVSAVEKWYAEKLKAEKTQKEEALSDDEFWNTPRDKQEAAKTDAESEGAFWDTPRIAETVAARDERVMQEKQQEHEVAFAAMWDKEVEAAKERYNSLIGVTRIISPKEGETVTATYKVIVEVDALHRDEVRLDVPGRGEFNVSLDKNGKFALDVSTNGSGTAKVRLSARGTDGWQHDQVSFTQRAPAPVQAPTSGFALLTAGPKSTDWYCRHCSYEYNDKERKTCRECGRAR